MLTSSPSLSSPLEASSKASPPVVLDSFKEGTRDREADLLGNVGCDTGRGYAWGGAFGVVGSVLSPCC